MTVSTSRKHRRVGVDYLMKGGICAAVVVEGESLLKKKIENQQLFHGVNIHSSFSVNHCFRKLLLIIM